MKYFFIGTDEAGYGPNLGPLVVSASLWRAGFTRTETSLSQLNERVLHCSERSAGFPIQDSKKLYHSGHLAPLERSFFFAYSLTEKGRKRLCKDGTGSFDLTEIGMKELVRDLAPEPESENRFRPPWEYGEEVRVPLTSDREWRENFFRDRQEETAALKAEGVYLEGIKSRRVQPGEFNLFLDRFGLKSDLLAYVTLQTALSLLKPVLEDDAQEREIIVCCDKLGGRNRYQDLLIPLFPDYFFVTEIESRALSRYRADVGRGRLTVLFQAKGESNIPSALASVVSKYLREVSMEAFNRYWRREVPGISSTAGYPVDAKRFRAETDLRRQELGIEDAVFWRNK